MNLNTFQPMTGSIMALAAVTLCASSYAKNPHEPPTDTAKSLQFIGAPFPESDAQKRSILASPTAIINGTQYPIGYHTLMRSGDTYGGTFGQLHDIKGAPLQRADGSPVISNSPDFSSLLPMGEQLFMVSQFESRPGAMYLSELKQDKATGVLTALSTRNIDLSGIHGGWVHCAGSVTPWNTHLSSEEYEPDAAQVDSRTGRKTLRGIEDRYYHAMDAYFGGNRSHMNPYFWGYPIEVKVINAKGDTAVKKHYAMGRIAYELSYVMPDQKTTYSTDDGTNVGLYMFIADRAGDLSAGTLHAAQLTQTGEAAHGGRFDIQWIDLGHAHHAEIAAYIEQKITFADIFNRTAAHADDTCPTGFTSINTTPGHECLQIKTGMEKAASRLETRRYAALRGATTELRKEEGITYDADHQRLYLAMSEVARGMEDVMKNGIAHRSYDKGGNNHIKVSHNLCGVVYALDVDEHYQARNMYPLVIGRMSQEKPHNCCDINGIANPDNLTYIPGYNTLIIGEDTGVGHQNDAIWAYHLDDETLTRIQTSPYGSETTSPYFYPNINGWGYLMSVIQHPYGESDAEKLKAGSGDDRAYTGFIGPFPAMD